MNDTQRTLVAIAGAALCSGIALINNQPINVTIGWGLVGLAIGALVDVILVVLAAWF